jgi:hypothetical protein
VAVFLAVSILALAGPAWQREVLPFAQDKAALVVALDLSRSMDAIDLSPSRLERAKQKVRDLLGRRQGARTALVVYAGTAHTVLPLTEDTEILEVYLEALATNLMPKPVTIFNSIVRLKADMSDPNITEIRGALFEPDLEQDVAGRLGAGVRDKNRDSVARGHALCACATRRELADWLGIDRYS